MSAGLSPPFDEAPLHSCAEAGDYAASTPGSPAGMSAPMLSATLDAEAFTEARARCAYHAVVWTCV